MRGNRRDRLIAAVLVIAAAVAILGHICVLPLHAHAVPIEGHGSHDEDAAEHSVHTASCEAVKAGSSVAGVIPAMTPTHLAVTSSPRPSRLSTSPAVLPAESPPLFLRHAALLI